MLGSGDYMILYADDNKSSTVYLLSIRHHRQLGFDFARLWPGGAQWEMESSQLNGIANFIVTAADDVLRCLYARGNYRDVTLPMIVLRQLARTSRARAGINAIFRCKTARRFPREDRRR